MWNRTLSKERFATPYERYHACNALKQALAKVGLTQEHGGVKNTSPN